MLQPSPLNAHDKFNTVIALYSLPPQAVVTVIIMDRRTFVIQASALAVAALSCSPRIALSATADATALNRTQLIASRADALLNLLDSDQRAKLLFSFARPPVAKAIPFKGGMRGDVDMVGEKYGDAVWSNFPVSDVPRPGLRMGSMSATQRAAVLSMLQVLLSANGYQKVLEIMGSDQALADGGTPYAAGRDAYTLAIFGKPSDDEPWMVQFGGHHLALNAVMMGGRGVLAPVLTGCLPAIYTEDSKTVRTLASENDKAFALLASLDKEQHQQAIIEHRVTDLAQGPGRDGDTQAPQGLDGARMTDAQRSMMFDLAGEWAGIINEVHAAPRLAEIKAQTDRTFFAWSGPTTHKPGRNGASYFRLQGPKLFIEFAPQEPGGDLTMHTHTIYRDPSNAYGRALA